MFVYCIGKSRLENLKAHLKRYGAVRRRHANTSRLPKNVLEQAVLNRTVTFIKNFATEHGVFLPGRAPSFKDLKVQLLPSSESKASIWRQYKKVSEESNLTVVSCAKFVALWNTLTPYIIVMKPASDLYSLCQLINSKINQNVNVSEQEKLNCLSDQETHLHEAKTEWEFMKTNIAAYQGDPVGPLRVLSTIRMIMHSKCISPPIPSNLALYILKHHGNVVCLECVVREFLGRLIILLTRQ